MKKTLLVLFIFLFFFFYLKKDLVNAQAVPLSFPGVTCGNATSTKPNERECCKKSAIVDNQFGKINVRSWIKWLPFGIGTIANDTVEQARVSALQLERDTSMVACPIGYPSNINDPNCTCLTSPNVTGAPIASIKNLCKDYIKNPNEEKKCEECADSAGVWTGLGICAYGDIGLFIQKVLLGWGIGLAGLVATLCIIYSAFQLQTSAGNPEKVKKSQELLTSCIMGLMLIIFSIFILRLIGVNILKIPGFM